MPPLKKMKRLPLLALLLASACATSPVLAQSYSTNDLIDPRYARESIRGGVEVDGGSFPLLIISWQPAPNRQFGVYQISGIEGYHSLARVEAFLAAFYGRYPKKGPDVPGIVLCGNNWGASVEVRPLLALHSARLGFSVWYAGGWAFFDAHLLPEPPDRLAALRAAFAASEPGQPAKK